MEYEKNWNANFIKVLVYVRENHSKKAINNNN